MEWKLGRCWRSCSSNASANTLLRCFVQPEQPRARSHLWIRPVSADNATPEALGDLAGTGTGACGNAADFVVVWELEGHILLFPQLSPL